MKNYSLISSCEVAINYALNRISKLDDTNKKALESEFQEWIQATKSDVKNYDVLFINKIN